MDAAAQRVYETDFAHLDPAPAAFARLPSGTVSATDRLFDAETRRRSVVLQEFLRPRGMEETLSGVVSPGGGRFAMLAMFRGADRAQFADADFDAMQQVLPHMAMALKLRRSFLRLETRFAALEATIDQIPLAVAVLGADGASHVNRAAAAVARRGDGLRFDLKGVPHAVIPAAEIRLRTLIAETRAGGAGGIVRLPRRDGAPPYVLLAAPLPMAAGKLAEQGEAERPVILLIHDPSALAEIAPETIAAAFDLTRPAAELLAALLAGEEAASYAARRGLSYETVRYHLKTAFGRTGVRNRGRLMQAVSLALRDIGRGRS
jgi:DNA-binding CsgD family transcriptional regulator/PAS domain-containing protein